MSYMTYQLSCFRSRFTLWVPLQPLDKAVIPNLIPLKSLFIINKQINKIKLTEKFPRRIQQNTICFPPRVANCYYFYQLVLFFLYIDRYMYIDISVNVGTNLSYTHSQVLWFEFESKLNLPDSLPLNSSYISGVPEWLSQISI